MTKDPRTQTPLLTGHLAPVWFYVFAEKADGASIGSAVLGL